MRHWLAVGFALLTGACKPAPPPRVQNRLVFECIQDNGKPLAGVNVTVAGQRVGATEADGRASTRVVGADGQDIPLAIVCPPPLQLVEGPSSVKLRKFTALEGPGAEDLKLRVRCDRPYRDVVIVARARGVGRGGVTVPMPNVAIKEGEQVVATTDDSGVALFHIRRAPAARVDLAMDLSGPEHTRLLPSSNVVAMEIPSEDDVLVFDRTFAERPVAARRKRKPPPLHRIRFVDSGGDGTLIDLR